LGLVSARPQVRRQRRTQQPPVEGRDYRGFPRWDRAKGSVVWRLVRRGNDPWRFSYSGAGRFDLRLPEGTCYLALRDLTAIVEVMGPEYLGQPVPESFFDQRELRQLWLPTGSAIADITDARAASFGVTNELACVTPYAIPRAWAGALRQAGFAAVRYPTRFDTKQPAAGVAVFGVAGLRGDLPSGRARPVDRVRLRRLLTEYGIQVVQTPASDEIYIQPPLDSSGR
jgi:hypothetical protein